MSEPALTVRQWVDLANAQRAHGDVWPDYFDDCIGEDGGQRAYIIATNNAALPDSDPRKITREKVAEIRTMAHDLRVRVKDTTPDRYHDLFALRVEQMLAFADALESYLPPPTPKEET